MFTTRPNRLVTAFTSLALFLLLLVPGTVRAGSALEPAPDLVGKWKEAENWWRVAGKGAFHTVNGTGELVILEQDGRTLHGTTTWTNADGTKGHSEFSGVITAGNDKIYAVEHTGGFKFIEIRGGALYQYYLEAAGQGSSGASAWFTVFRRE